MPPSKVKVLVPDVPAEVRVAVDAFAAEHDISRNAVAVQALEGRYRLTLSEPVVGYRPNPEFLQAGSWSVDVPVKVRAALRREAASKGATISGIVRATLQEKFGLEVEPLVARRVKSPQ